MDPSRVHFWGPVHWGGKPSIQRRARRIEKEKGRLEAGCIALIVLSVAPLSPGTEIFAGTLYSFSKETHPFIAILISVVVLVVDLTFIQHNM